MNAPARLFDRRRGAGGEVEDADGGLAHGAHQAPAEAGEESTDTLASEAVVGLKIEVLFSLRKASCLDG